MKKYILKHLALYFSALAVCIILFDAGFIQNTSTEQVINILYFFCLLCIIISVPVRYVFNFKSYKNLRIWIIDLTLWLFYNYLLISIHFKDLAADTEGFLIPPKIWLFLAFSISLLRELSAVKINWRYKHINPAAIFVCSFLLLVVFGSFMLMVPRAAYSRIHYTDALFTSTSAVCVTGLVVVDTGTYFTMFGQLIILVLIQLGGIGIMTFTSFFSYFFIGGSSFQTLIMLGNITNENEIAQVIGTLKKILFFTFLVETVAFLFIYLNIKTKPEIGLQDPVFFSIFHAVSAFCNAGFSTITGSFYNIDFRFNYCLHVILAICFIIGGLGFPVMINIFTAIKHWFLNIAYRILRIKGKKFRLPVLSLNTKIVLYTTLILLITGTITFFVSEYNNTLSEHNGPGKIITAFFGAATPRTAGFNTVETSAIRIPLLMFIIFLMWVGASPGSTGGGIKTSTLALAVLNTVNLARGKDRIELDHRQIHESSISRSFAFMFLSLIVIGLVILLLFITESDKHFTDLIFEVFSAFSTVGLSRGITGDLSQAGKIIIVFTMFIGRVGALTLLISFMRKSSKRFIQYPVEGIIIN